MNTCIGRGRDVVFLIHKHACTKKSTDGIELSNAPCIYRFSLFDAMLS